MNKEQIKSEREVVKDHDQDRYEAEFKAAKRKEKEVHLTQTHAIFEMVSDLVEGAKSKRFSLAQLALVLVCFYSSCAIGGKLWRGSWWFEEPRVGANFDSVQYKRETVTAFKALLTDSDEYMEESTKFVAIRRDGERRGMRWATDWTRSYQSQFVALAIDANKTNVLNWIRRQDNWGANCDPEVARAMPNIGASGGE